MQGGFLLTTEGPWPINLTVDSGSGCVDRSFRNFGGVAKRLNAYELPAHGKLELHEGGRFSYKPAAGYRGSDAFLLEVCGTTYTGANVCSKLSFAVTVR